MLARDRPPLPRSFLAGAPSPSRKLEGDKATPYPRYLMVQKLDCVLRRTSDVLSRQPQPRRCAFGGEQFHQLGFGER
jgi:hypothetical protein